MSKLNGLLAGVLTVNCAVLEVGAAPAGGLDGTVAGAVGLTDGLGRAVGCGAAGAGAPIFSATSCGGLPSPTGISSVSPATDMNPLIPPGACQVHTCAPDFRSKARTLPVKVDVKTRSPTTVAAPKSGASRFAFHWIWPVAASIASSSPVPFATSAMVNFVAVKLEAAFTTGT